MNEPKATELRQAEVAPAGRLSRYRENLGLSTKSNLKLKTPVLTKIGTGIFLLRHLSRRYRYIHLRSGSVLTALDQV